MLLNAMKITSLGTTPFQWARL